MSDNSKKGFIISTDSSSDLPDEIIRQYNIPIHPLYYNINNTVYGYENNMPISRFYAMMRDGAAPVTSATNPDVVGKLFTKQVEEGYDILHLSFSSGLSSTYNTTVICAREVMESHPSSRIVVIDTLAASLGQGLLVYYALQMQQAGKSMDEIIQWVEDNKLHLCHHFTVDNLKYLHRGGRISRSVAIVGTIINVKPVLHVDNDGHLVSVSNVRGRKKSLIALVNNMEKQLQGYRDVNETVFISHGDSLEDAQFVADLVKERFGINSFVIGFCSPTIGAHSGPGTIALFHLGKER